MLAPRSAYYFTQLVEEHAYHTYDQFLQAHEAELKTQPAPKLPSITTATATFTCLMSSKPAIR